MPERCNARRARAPVHRSLTSARPREEDQACLSHPPQEGSCFNHAIEDSGERTIARYGLGVVVRSRTRNVRSRAALTAVLVWMMAAASATAQDSEAPPSASQRWLPCERWVMQHWLPYDERRLFRMLRVTREEARVWIADDVHHSFAQLVRRRGLTLDVAVDRLVVPWTRGQGGVRQNVLRARALSTLTQSHLSQHVLFHEFHHPLREPRRGRCSIRRRCST